MPCSKNLQFDEVGNWTEVKLEIIRKYATAYSKILSKQSYIHHVYIDGCCGAGKLLSKDRVRIINGSPLVALKIMPPFEEYYFIDMDSDKVDYLKTQIKNQKNVFIIEGDCNTVLLKAIFPQIRFDNYKRALCLLDPYGLQLDWTVIKTASKSGVIDIFINFPVVDVNRNVCWRNPKNVSEYNLNRMNRFWGDESWKNIAYHEEQTLFGPEAVKGENYDIAEGFRTRLKEVAQFQYVPEPIPMKNSKGSTIYYLFFASEKQVAVDIINDIFKKYR